jgi:acetoin utilization protein AcuB
MHRTRVRDIMTHEPVSIDPDLRINVALEMMSNAGVRRLPVLSSTGRVIGLISKNDALIALPHEHGGLANSVAEIPRIREVMSDYVYTIGPDDSIAKAASMMANHGISCLPVLDETKKLVGIVTESDIFKFVASQMPDDEE